MSKWFNIYPRGHILYDVIFFNDKNRKKVRCNLDIASTLHLHYNNNYYHTVLCIYHQRINLAIDTRHDGKIHSKELLITISTSSSKNVLCVSKTVRFYSILLPRRGSFVFGTKNTHSGILMKLCSECSQTLKNHA